MSKDFSEVGQTRQISWSQVFTTPVDIKNDDKIVFPIFLFEFLAVNESRIRVLVIFR